MDFRDQTYFKTPQNIQEDRIQIEIGDSKQPDKFYPQIKLMRWDNELNLSVRLMDSFQGEAIISQKGDRIEWIKPTIKSHFYDHSEDGFEFEIILKEKPVSNKLQFSIQTKNLDFFYQSSLTQKEIDDGHVRPENIVGSYAVYHSEKNGDYSQAGGKNYRAGKAFHIYRPKVTDVVGKEIWGELNIDTDSGILSVTIDQAFLDTAIYPLIIDPTFGYTTAGASSTSISNNQLLGSIFDSSSDTKTATSLTVSCDEVTGFHSYFKGVLVLHSNLNIVTNGVGGAVEAPTTKGWKTSTFSTPPNVTPSTSYLLSAVLFLDTGDTVLFFYDAGATNQSHSDTSNSYSTPTNPTDAVHGNNKYSIYCTYAAVTHYTLAIASGNLSLSETAVALKYGHPLAIASGSLSLTGQAIALRAARRLSIASGAITLTGQEVFLRLLNLINIESGSFQLTGTDVNLFYGKYISLAETITFSETLYFKKTLLQYSLQSVITSTNTIISTISRTYDIQGNVVRIISVDSKIS